MAVRDAVTRGPDPLAVAEAAFARVEADAEAAARLAGDALRGARARRAPEAEVAALHALAYARYELGDPRSLRTARSAVRAAERHGLPIRAAHARRRLAIDLCARGRAEEARRELDRACEAFGELELARTEVFRIAVDLLSGRSPVSLEAADAA